jgi:hypothetical protein
VSFAAVVEQLPAEQQSGLRGIDFVDMRPHLRDGYVVKGLLLPNTLAGIIGVTGSGKTFFATDLAMHIAANRPWRGHRIQGGLVIYAALEGPISAENRFCACRQLGGFTDGIPLRLTPGPINLRNFTDVETLNTFIREAESLHGAKCVAVFVDTLSRAMAGGDENGPEDMGALIAGADAVRLATGAAVILVHHLGKDETRGARGHSSFKAALDTEIEVSKSDELHVATVTKQRDMATGGKFAFRLEPVTLGMDVDGDGVTTCVVRPADAPAPKRKGPAGKNQGKLLAGLAEWFRTREGQEYISGIDMSAVGKAQGMNRNRLREAIEGLERLGWLQPSIGGYRFDAHGSA